MIRVPLLFHVVYFFLPPPAAVGKTLVDIQAEEADHELADLHAKASQAAHVASLNKGACGWHIFSQTE